MQIETLAIHAGSNIDPLTGALIPPLHLSTTFARHPDGSYPQGYIYTRSGNPNRDALEECLCQLEAGAAAIAFASGSTATTSLFQALRPGDHVIVPDQMYYGTAQILQSLFIPWGLRASFVEMTDLAQVKAAIQPQTRMIWIETPSNPLLKVSDIAAIATIAHEADAICVCDSTWATPILQRPLELGADWVIHATTKYLGGHSDVLGGVAIAREPDAFYQRVRQIQVTAGAVPSPFDCWLIQRGIRTLACRMRVHSENALQVAHFLAAQPQVETVHYPGLVSHAGHGIALGQMRSFGGMLSFQVKGGQDAAMAVAAAVQLFTRATSLGGFESLIEHRASIEGPESQTPPNLLRLAIGLEHYQDLITDLAQALTLIG